METKQIESLWTSTDLMKFLGCGKTAFFEAKRNGNLPPAIRIGRGIWRWSPQTVKIWVAKNESAVSVDPIFSSRSVEAVSSKKRSKSCKEVKTSTGKGRGRPTKREQIYNRLNKAEGV